MQQPQHPKFPVCKVQQATVLQETSGNVRNPHEKGLLQKIPGAVLFCPVSDNADPFSGIPYDGSP
jgi:hypothetical protein